MQIIKNIANAFLHKISSLLHEDIEFHVCILIVWEKAAGFIECIGCISYEALIFLK